MHDSAPRRSVLPVPKQPMCRRAADEGHPRLQLLRAPEIVPRAAGNPTLAWRPDAAQRQRGGVQRNVRSAVLPEVQMPHIVSG